MTREKSNPVAWLLPSLADVAFLVPLAMLMKSPRGIGQLLGDADTGWHIRTGQWILQHLQVPRVDLFSFTMPNQPWFAWEWLWDVVFGWLHLHWGMAAVVLVSLLAICTTSVLVFQLAHRLSGDPLISLVVSGAAICATSIHWLARPHLFTWIFAIVFLGILESAREGTVRRLLWLPFLTVLWTNLHGGFVVGLAMVGIYGAGELATWLLEADRVVAANALRRSRPFLLVFAACAAATLLNPYGWHLHQHIYGYLTDAFQYQYIVEMGPVRFRQPLAVFFEPIILIAVVSLGWNLYCRRFTHALLLAFWVHLGLQAVRNLPLLMIVTAPLVAVQLRDCLRGIAFTPLSPWAVRFARSLREISSELDGMNRVVRGHTVPVLVVGLLAWLIYLPAPPARLHAVYDPAKYPERALTACSLLDGSARVYTNDEWGDYLIYRLYPKGKVFVDGRSDFYGAAFGKKYMDLLSPGAGWESVLDEYQIGTVLLPLDSTLVPTLRASGRWQTAYRDSTSVVFARESGRDRQQVSALSIGAAERPVIRKITKQQP